MRQIIRLITTPVLATGLFLSSEWAISKDTKSVTATAATAVTVSGMMNFPANIVSLGQGWYQANLEIPAFFASSIREGQSVQLQLPFAQNRALTSDLKIDGKNQPYLKFQFPHSAPTGMSLSARLKVASTELYKVPLGSVFSPTENEQWVFTIENQRAKKIRIKPWKLKDAHLLVSAPLKNDALIISSRLNEIYNNQLVEVNP